MGNSTRRRLVIPTLLAACVIAAAPSCEQDERREESVSGEDECYDIVDQATCEAETAFLCRWSETSMSCSPNCGAYPDEDACNGDDSCEWTGDACDLHI